MRCKWIVALSLAAIVSFSGCNSRYATRQNSQPRQLAMAGGGGGGGDRSRMSATELDLVAYASDRYIAETHTLSLISPESTLQKSWEDTLSFCRTLRCEVLSSRITLRNGENAPSGEIALRVIPDDFPKLLVRLGQIATISDHSTEREDKTDEVIDTDAQLKNLTAFRDNLRTMLGKPGAKVSDLIEIQKQLTETQAKLDAAALRRQALANETEKISVEISCRVAEPSIHNTSGLAQIALAFRRSGLILADSVANVVETVVFLIPWLILAIPLTWLLAKLWRKRKLRRASQ